MQNLPAYISIIFIFTTIYSVFVFVKALKGFTTALYVLLIWVALQGVVAYSGFYTYTKNIPPRFSLTIGPALLCIILLFVTNKGRQLLDRFNLQTLTLLHLVRVPVEIVLFSLYMQKAIPQIMTFEGSNFDILSGLTAPLVWYLMRRGTNTNLLLLWNVICLGLLLNIVIIAILAAPFDFQRIAFDQPNIAVFYFPFVWLPACIVPLVLLAHLAAIRQLLQKNNHYKFRVASTS
jgi:hypothetical protein